MGTHPIFESDFDCLTECPFSWKTLAVRFCLPGRCHRHKHRILHQQLLEVSRLIWERLSWLSNLMVVSLSVLIVGHLPELISSTELQTNLQKYMTESIAADQEAPQTL